MDVPVTKVQYPREFIRENITVDDSRKKGDAAVDGLGGTDKNSCRTGRIQNVTNMPYSCGSAVSNLCNVLSDLWRFSVSEGRYF